MYGNAFNPLVAQKTLAWFEGGDLGSLSDTTRRLLVEHATRDVAVVPLARLSDRLD